MPDSQPSSAGINLAPVLVTEQMVMFGNAAVVQPGLDRIARRLLDALRVAVVAFGAPALYAHSGWYVERSLACHGE